MSTAATSTDVKALGVDVKKIEGSNFANGGGGGKVISPRRARMAGVLASAQSMRHDHSWPEAIARAVRYASRALELIQHQSLAFDVVDSYVDQAVHAHAPTDENPSSTSTANSTTNAATVTTATTATNINVTTTTIDGDKAPTKSASSASLGSIGSLSSDSANTPITEGRESTVHSLKSALIVGAASILVAQSEALDHKADPDEFVQLTISLVFLNTELERTVRCWPKAVALEVKPKSTIAQVIEELNKQLPKMFAKIQKTDVQMTTTLKTLLIGTGTEPSKEVALLESCRIYPTQLFAVIDAIIERN